MNGTFNQAWTYVAEERSAEYARKAARQQLLDQARSKSPATDNVSITRLAHQLATHITRRRFGEHREQTPPPPIGGNQAQLAIG